MTRSTEVKLHGRWLRPGTEVSIRGVRGRFRFHEMVEHLGQTWVTVWGGTKDYGSWRSFDPERIKAVHTKERMR